MIRWRREVSRFVRRAALLPLVTLSVAAHAQDDVLETVGGDTLTGEVKSLDRGMLRFDTDATDTIPIQWTHVSVLRSEQNFLVTLSDGRQLFGRWVESQQAGMLTLATAIGDIELPVNTVVRMSPIEGRLIDRISMSVDVGYNFAKANNQNQTTLGFAFGYRTEERLISSTVDIARSSTNDSPVSFRGNSNFSYRRFIEERDWDPIAFGGFERNDELGLDRRVTVGGGMSRWLADTNSRRISFVGGLVATRENETDAADSDESIEAAAVLALDWFRYDDPELDVALQFSVYERLSDTRRTRGNLDLDVRWELINDFFWGFSIYYSFNTEPTGTASRDDYGVVTSIGWSF